MKPEDDKIEIQMKSEVARAEWVPIKDLKDLPFAPTASRIIQKVIENEGNLEKLALEPVEYEVSGKQNVLYISNHNHFN